MGGGADGPKRPALFRFGTFISKQLKEGFTLEDVVEGNEKFLKSHLPKNCAIVIHFIFMYFLGHLYIGYAILRPLIDRLKQQHGIYKLKESVSILRSEITLSLFALSAFFHVYSVPSVLNYLNWVFTLRPQINVKPQMTVVTRRSRSAIAPITTVEEFESLAAIKSSRSKSVNDITECFTSGPTSVDVNWDVKIRDGITDKIWSGIERISDTASLASGLQNSLFESSFASSSVASGISEYTFNARDLDNPSVYPWNDSTDETFFLNGNQSDVDYNTAPESSDTEA